ncbi:MAG TPA: hypothetical protein VF771_15155 [Longimicrobiaceae bacterium]
MSTTTDATTTAAGTDAPLVPIDGFPLLDYRQLRALAEYASGVRKEGTVWLAAYGDGRIDEVEPGIVPDGALLVATHVGRGAGNRDATEYAWIGDRADGKGSVNLLDIDGTGMRGDSVFWTQSSVEKFLVPYYASVSGEAAPRHITTLLGLLGSRHPVPVKAGQDPADYEVYALIHLPQSEYVDQAGDTPGAEYPADLAVALRATGGEGPCVAVHARELASLRPS